MMIYVYGVYIYQPSWGLHIFGGGIKIGGS